MKRTSSTWHNKQLKIPGARGPEQLSMLTRRHTPSQRENSPVPYQSRLRSKVKGERSRVCAEKQFRINKTVVSTDHSITTIKNKASSLSSITSSASSTTDHDKVFHFFLFFFSIGIYKLMQLTFFSIFILYL